MSSEDISIALAGLLDGLGLRFDTPEDEASFAHHTTNGAVPARISLPGSRTPAKAHLEGVVSSLASRISLLEARASLVDARALPITPNESEASAGLAAPEEAKEVAHKKHSHGRSRSGSKRSQNKPLSSLLSGHDNNSQGRSKKYEWSEDEMGSIHEHINDQAEQIRIQKQYIDHVSQQLTHQQTQTEKAIGGLSSGVEDIDSLKRELLKHQQANMAFQKSLREIGDIITAVANGDLSKKVLIHQKELDPEITVFKITINTMVDQLQEFAVQVSHLARETGTEGRLGGQAVLPGVSGIWAELTTNVNIMSTQLTEQVRDIAKVTTAVARGDLTQKVTAPCKGEIEELKVTINAMVDQLRQFAEEVTHLALEVGTHGRLGGQAMVHGVEGTWKELTSTVNNLAMSLTVQVREIAEVTTAVAKGDLSRMVEADVDGEILALKNTINGMVERLRTFAFEVSKVAREVGTEGILGGQAKVENVDGKWRDLTDRVNVMARNLTSQVRAFADITSAAISGDFSQEIMIEASGEMDELKRKINTMVSGLRESFEKINNAREVAETANKTKSEFLANMSHEIRTPMNGIIGMTQLTLDTELQTSQRDMLNTVHNLANSLLLIIDDILDISKIEANRMDLEQIPFSLRSTIFNALKTLAVKANERFLNLAYQVDHKIPDWVVGDPFRLRQIIVNLVGNSLKFTERGEVKVRICETPQLGCEDGEYLVKFSVTDTGIGIPEEKIGVIFETFQQADGSTTRRFGGTGLGLSISKKLVNLMGGNMWVESSYGRGSTFFFTCKVRHADGDIMTIEPKMREYKKHNILLIDTGKTGHVKEIVAGLQKLDLIVNVLDEPDDGPPQLQQMNGAPYDCVIIDNNTKARTLRELERFKYTPLVLLSPQINVSFKSALEDGISSYMTTPCSAIDLANALIPALEGRATPSVSDSSRSFDILLAEDNKVNQKLAVKILEKYNHQVTVANNGQEALDKIKMHRYDVVLMDVQMPISKY